METTISGPLPRIGNDGRTPMIAYAGAGATAGKRPRIAIVISNLGISAKQTAQALAILPKAVTLAFAPYADDVQHWVSEARRNGHEVLVQIPMEPEGPEKSDPGPHTLLAVNDDGRNTERLVWALTRFTGYAGATNMEGERFLSDEDALAPVLGYMAKRGLLFFDDGEAANSQAAQVAARVGIAFLRSTGRIDSIGNLPEIVRHLSYLETHARQFGSAVGSASSDPMTLESISTWAGQLAAHGFVLVPASAIVSTAKAG
jgi:polysaccharide deacetylase 2 family uncharacterized protein YibQ